MFFRNGSINLTPIDHVALCGNSHRLKAVNYCRKELHRKRDMGSESASVFINQVLNKLRHINIK